MTLDMVEDFVSLGIPENLTVEYKKQGDKPVEAVAALANTYGGIVLIGVAEDSGTRGVPTAVVGVNRKEKEKLVNQMATGYDPPWTPEVIEVPLREADKVVLVVRIDQDLVPAPIVTDGSILVRLDGRNVKANRQMMAAMLRQAEAVEPGLGLQRRNATRSPGIHWPVDGADPDAARADLQLRAVTSVALPRGKHRDRLPSGIGGKMLLPLTQSKLRDVIQQFSDSPLRQGTGWKVHRITSRTIEFRLRDKGTGGRESVQPQGRVVVDVNGGFLEVIADISLWPRGGPLAWLTVQLAFLRLVPVVADVLLPAAVAAVTGPVTLPPPPVEIHLSNEKFAGEVVRIEKSIDLSPLGARTGSNPSALGRAGEVVDETLIKDGDWTPAVLDALTTMTMDWGYA
ncbi:ATP-binding protein [Streptomyces sp. MT29]|nr:ATP-binding protein [Streptomyces sp. MT29]